MTKREIRRYYAQKRRAEKIKLYREQFLDKRTRDICSTVFTNGIYDLTPYNAERLINGRSEENIVYR